MTEGARLFEFGGFRLDPARRLLVGRGGEPILLKPKVFDTLLYLVEHTGQLLDKAVLMKGVWGDVIVEENSLNQHISLLRRVFGESPGDNSFIVTVPGRGYRFVATVRTLTPAPKESLAANDVADPSPGTRGTATTTGIAKHRYFVSALAALAVLAVVGGQLLQSNDNALPPGNGPTTNVIRLQLEVLPEHRLAGGSGWENVDLALQRPSRPSFALSPNGQYLVYTATDGTTTRLYRRRMDEQQTVLMPGTEGAAQPFFSPDSRHVAFRVGNALKRSPIEGGDVVAIATAVAASDSVGGSWTENDTILVSTEDGVHELPAAGGRAVRLTQVNSSAGERLHLFPQMLPQRRAVLFNVAGSSPIPSEWTIEAATVDGSERKLVLQRASHPVYVPTGHIVFARSGVLLAVPFDVTRLEVTGAPIVIVERVMHAERGGSTALNTGAAQFSVSSAGSFAYVEGGVYPEPVSPLLLLDRGGETRALPLPPARYVHPRFSPDGTKLAFAIGSLGEEQIWVYDLERDVKMPLTKTGANVAPVWSPDGKRLAFERRGTRTIYSIAADGSGEPQLIGEGTLPSSWFGDVLAFVDVLYLGARAEIWTIDTVSGERTPFVHTDEDPSHPAFSPDGAAIAYGSAVSQRPEVYIRRFPESVPPQVIAGARTRAPIWSRDGRELFFIEHVGPPSTRVRMMVVDVTTEPPFAHDRPRVLFEGEYLVTTPIHSHDVSPDGRFVMVGKPAWSDPQPAMTINIVLNWFEELRERARPLHQQ